MNTQTIDEAAGAGRAPSAEGAMAPIKVWDLPTRVFHWSLAASFAGAYITAESERWRDVHVLLGYTLAGLIAFRLVWGVIGTRYARFTSFVFPPSRVVAYVKSLLAGSPEHHVGHNPAGALAIFLLLGLGLVTAASGFMTYQEMGGEWLEDLHEGAANAMLAVVVIHLAGVVVSSLLHRENLVRSMLTGNKQGRSDEGIPRSRALVGIALLVAVLGFWTADRAGWINAGEFGGFGGTGITGAPGGGGGRGAALDDRRGGGDHDRGRGRGKRERDHDD
jgi:cytochrome b